ncbi:MAG: N-acetylmuramoyl-L-alanine amidase-like domain-containing protein [Legionella sp.]|jgi:hypothetical protein
MIKGFKYLAYVAGMIIGFASYSNDTHSIEEQANLAIKQLYNKSPDISMTSRIDWFSAQFKDAPYLLGSLGEGPDAPYDQFPRYRVDVFDCDTFVNTVVSLALANSLTGFQQCINLNRYKDGKVSYINRNHFTGLDWNINNQQRGVLKDITLDIKDEQNRPVALMAQAVINKSSWYAHKTLADIRLQNNDPQEQKQRLEELKAEGAPLGSTPSSLPYLPFTALFTKEKPNLYLFSQIPQGAIIEIVRPNWNLSDEIGTNLNVSHLGFAIWEKGTLYFRQASSEYKKVVDVPLIDYLHNATKSPTIKGINVQILVPQKPLAHCS